MVKSLVLIFQMINLPFKDCLLVYHLIASTLSEGLTLFKISQFFLKDCDLKGLSGRACVLNLQGFQRDKLHSRGKCNRGSDSLGTFLEMISFNSFR